MPFRTNVALKGLLGRMVPICLLALSTAVLAQNDPLVTDAATPPKTIRAYNRDIFEGVKAIVLRAAEVMPEENYNFKPVDTVRSFGQILGHIADSQYYFCSIVRGDQYSARRVEQTKTNKADLIAALRDAFAYCEKAHDGMTEASASQVVQFMGGEAPKLGVLTNNSLHTIEHYGNIVTYLRMKGIVPPTSDPAFMQELMKK